MPPAGFKIGATAKRMQDYLGLSGPAAGFMPAAGLHRERRGAAPSPASSDPGVECELAVRLARDLPPGPCTPDAGRARRWASCSPASRSSRTATATSPRSARRRLIADQVFHAAAVLGEPLRGLARRSISPTLAGRMTVDGESRGEGSAPTCSAIRWTPGLARGLGRRPPRSAACGPGRW